MFVLCRTHVDSINQDHKKALCPYLDVSGEKLQGLKKMALAHRLAHLPPLLLFLRNYTVINLFFCFTHVVATAVVASRERHEATDPGAIPKICPSKPPQSPDGEKTWAQQTSTIDLVSENANGLDEVMVTGKMPLPREFSGLHVPPLPLHNAQQMLKQAGVYQDTQPTKSGATSPSKGRYIYVCDTHHVLCKY